MERIINYGSVLAFYSKEKVKVFLKELTDNYKHEADRYGEKLGELLRKPIQESKEKKGKKQVSKGWVKMGSIMLNTSDAQVGTTEILLGAMENAKTKLERTLESLKSLDAISNVKVPEEACYILYLKDGMPERLIIDGQEAKPQKFNFQANFRIV